MKLYVKIALFFVSFIALSAILAALYMFNLKYTDMAKANPDFVCTALDLLQKFEDDETAASAMYINKIVEVTGTIRSVNPAGKNVLKVSLVTANDFSSVICTLPAITDPLKFISGDVITLRGKCSGFQSDVLLDNCAVIKEKLKL